MISLELISNFFCSCHLIWAHWRMRNENGDWKRANQKLLSKSKRIWTIHTMPKNTCDTFGNRDYIAKDFSNIIIAFIQRVLMIHIESWRLIHSCRFMSIKLLSLYLNERVCFSCSWSLQGLRAMRHHAGERIVISSVPIERVPCSNQKGIWLTLNLIRSS